MISIAYFMIAYAIVRPLISSRQLTTNALSAATAALFLTCAVHHGAHVVHMLMPYTGVDLEQGLAMRQAWGPGLAIWDSDLIGDDPRPPSEPAAAHLAGTGGRPA